ncbi:hypothetical protein CF326_g8722 [Tilletia indica]|uniref:FHA domain-containing protein n=1 Tax=Tilletia indica TaxID=43049 RepID=A0A177SZL1_9BASI|nr:hypothetical protein CF326_g8722 [Tilletia indica]KAE8236978.1 hypothetical protein A4X13_0g8963 [Tilletia indica]
MPSPSFIRVLTLRPISSPSQQQSVAFCRSDTFTLLFGGTHRSDRYGALACPVRSADVHFDDPLLCPDHATIAVSSGQALVHQHRKEDAIRVNVRMLADDQQVQLQDGDLIELGHLDEYDGEFRRNSAFQVFLTDPSAMVQHNRQALPAAALLPLPPNLLAAFASEADSAKQLRSDLQAAQQRLQDALDANRTHTCVQPQPPRPYNALLADLRAQSSTFDYASRPSTPLASSAPAAPSSSRSSCSLRKCTSTLSSSDSSLTVADSSSASEFESESSTSTFKSHSSPPATSVLTSVLGSAQLSPLPSVLAQASTFRTTSTSSTSASFSSSTSRLASSSSPLSSALTLRTATRTSPSSSTESSSAQASLATSSSSCSALSTASVLTSVLGSVDDSPHAPAFSITPPVLNTIHSQRDTSAPPPTSSPPRTTASALTLSSADPAAVETSGQGKLRSASVECVGATSRGTTSLSRRSIDDVLVNVRQQWIGARAAMLGQSRTMETAEIATSQIFEAYTIERSASQPASIGQATAISQSAASSRGGTSASALPLLLRELSTEPPAAADPHATQPSSSRTISSTSTACSGPPAMAFHIPSPRRR